jgi:cysteinyl-tRNA synthetase
VRVFANPEKRGPLDFALWKFADGEIGWQSPWGRGFPGWHIECSAMSVKYLGQPFDIHTGGIDHIPVHHQNEIAEAEAAAGKPLARFWMHSAFVNMAEGKMAKSEGNFLTLSGLKNKGISALIYRYWLLGAHYRTPMEWSEKAMEGAKNAYERMADNFVSLGEETGSLKRLGTGQINENYQKKFREALNDDLGTPLALSLVWEVLGDRKLSKKDKRATLLDFDRVLGLDLATLRAAPIPPEIQKLADEREAARAMKDWKTSDKLRQKIEKMGYEIRDGADGSVLRKL